MQKPSNVKEAAEILKTLVANNKDQEIKDFLNQYTGEKAALIALAVVDFIAEPINSTDLFSVLITH